MMNPKRFLAIRDKKDSPQKRGRTVQPGQKLRTSTDGFLSMFRSESSRQATKEEQEREEKEAAKIDEIAQGLEELGLTHFTTDNIRDALSSRFAQGDPRKTIEYLDLQGKAWRGVILPYDPSVQMVGAVNRNLTTCYLDALLFAMFARMDAYEGMLKNDFPDDPVKKRLSIVLRLWVNMLRTGNLIHTDLTKLLQDCLGEAGWPDAALIEQQDTSEAFGFISETLHHPLLPLQVDLFHQGIKDADDHKVVYERLLNLAIPDVKGVRLEDCLEEYFNTKVDVLRDSQEDSKGGGGGGGDSRSILSGKSTIRLVTEDDGAERDSSDCISASQMPLSPLERRVTAPSMSGSPNTGQPPTSPARPSPRHRSTSVIQRVFLDGQGRPSGGPGIEHPASPQQKSIRTGSTLVKAVTIPAWQFFRLIPWHSTSNQEPSNDMEVATNLDQRPVVGICLKRYTMDTWGPKRIDTYVDIPDSLRLPHFMLPVDDDLEESPNGLSTDYKLVLQSVVCHRGNSLHGGHYISFARVAPKLLTGNRRHSYDPPPDYEEAQWVRFDDLDTDRRVAEVDDIRQCLREEMPYLLFYQIVPMMDGLCAASDETRPPSYDDSLGKTTRSYVDSLEKTTRSLSEPGPDTAASSVSCAAASDYFGSPTIEPSLQETPSMRVSVDADRPVLELPPAEESTSASGRASVNLADSLGDVSNLDSVSHTPAATPSEETTAQRLSRAAARLARASKSRPASQAGEGRIGIAKRGLGNLMRSSKEPLAESAVNPCTTTPAAATAAGQEPQAERPSCDGAVPSAAAAADSETQPLPKGHKRAKSKDKDRTKAPPERECAVM